MFRDIRHSLIQRQAEKRKAKLKAVEKERRLSYLRTKHYEERKSAEEGLKAQISAEQETHMSAKQALAERRRMMKELSEARGDPSVSRTAREVGKISKKIFYDVPKKSLQVASKMSQKGGVERILIGNTTLLTGKPRGTAQGEKLNEVVFGPGVTRRADTPVLKKEKDLDILG